MPEGTEEIQKDDAFESAFDQAEGTEKKDLSDADNPSMEQKEEIKEEPKEVKEIPKEESKVEPETSEAPPEEAKFEQRYKSLVGVHKHDREVWETEKATLISQMEQLKKVPEQGKELTVKEEAKRDEALKDLYESLTPEQKASLKEYDEEFDIVSKMEGLKREAALKKLTDKMDALEAKILEKLAPAENLVVETQKDKEIKAKEDHFNAIAEAHSDFEKHRDSGSIIKWIESKPKYLQKGFMDVYQTGTADDIVALLNDFKTENNLQAPPDNTVNFNAKREEKRMALAAVNTKRGAVNTSMPVAEDYENAFEEALHKAKI